MQIIPEKEYSLIQVGQAVSGKSILESTPKMIESSAGSTMDRLKELKAMLDEGLISQEDYDLQKQRIIAGL